MKKLYLIFICLIINVSFGYGQNREVFSLDFEYQSIEGTYTNTDSTYKGLKAVNTAQSATFESQAIQTNLQDVAPFLSASLKWQTSGTMDVHDIELYVRTSIDAQNWDEWQPIHTDTHAPVQKDVYIGKLMFFDENTQFIQTRIVTKKASVIFKKLDIHLYNPGKTPPVKTGQKKDSANDVLQSNCPCDQPNYLSRNQWCPAGNCPPSSNPSSTSPTHLIVHHSDHSNSSSDWAAVVRSIWNYHIYTNGWDDIGYNWLIDRNGVVYEGRGAGILGSHFCGKNTGTQGNCLLGNFTNTQPSNAARTKMVELLAWQSCQYNINPTGTSYHNSSGFSLNNIAGHRQSCNTECPGSSFYNQLGNLRQEIDDYIDGCGSGGAVCLAPTNLSMSSIGTTTATVSFNDPNSMNGNTYTAVLIDAATQQVLGANNGLTSTIIDVEGLVACTDYIIVLATNCNAIGEASEIVDISFSTECIADCPAPTNVTAEITDFNAATEEATVNVDWDNMPVPGGEDYRVWFTNPQTGNWEDDFSGGSSEDIDVPCGTTQIYVVTECSDGGISPPSQNIVLNIECRPLPIEMLTPLQAHIKNKSVILEWQTATETNNSGFEIQRSRSGIEWGKIAWQEGQGNSSVPFTYTYADMSPLNGTSYYRLRQVDFDGNFSYSNIVDVSYTSDGIALYPNPVKNTLYIAGLDGRQVQELSLFDMNGKMIRTFEFPPNSIDIAGMSSGMYAVKVTIDSGVVYRKILIE